MERHRQSPSKWPGGISLTVGLLSFVASAFAGGGGTLAGALVAGVLNPVFLVACPLGIYLLTRTAPPD